MSELDNKQQPGWKGVIGTVGAARKVKRLCRRTGWEAARSKTFGRGSGGLQGRHRIAVNGRLDTAQQDSGLDRTDGVS